MKSPSTDVETTGATALSKVPSEPDEDVADPIAALARHAERLSAESEAREPPYPVSEALPLTSLFPGLSTGGDAGSAPPPALEAAGAAETASPEPPPETATAAGPLDEAAIARLLREIQTGVEDPAHPSAEALSRRPQAGRREEEEALATLATSRRPRSDSTALAVREPGFTLAPLPSAPRLPAVATQPPLPVELGTEAGTALATTTARRPSGAPGFLTGLAIAGAIGAVLYALLVS